MEPRGCQMQPWPVWSTWSPAISHQPHIAYGESGLPLHGFNQSSGRWLWPSSASWCGKSQEKQTKPNQKTENILNHTKPPQKKDVFLISFMSASNSTNNRAKATQGREDRAPQHHQRMRDLQENFVQIYTKTLSLAAISHFCLSISLLPCINTWAKPERHQGPLNALDTTRASQAHPSGSPPA